jgi:hypothetical protein
MNRLRLLAMGAWGLAFLVGLLVLVWRTISAEPVQFARQEMPANHFVRRMDLSSPMGADLFTGKYLRRRVIRGETLTQRDVSPTPLLPTDAGPLLMMSTPVASVGTTVEAQKKGEICRDADAVAAAEAVAIACDPPDNSGTCHALVRAASAADTKKLAERLVKDGPTTFWFKASCK